MNVNGIYLETFLIIPLNYSYLWKILRYSRSTKKMVLTSLTFMVDPIINLMNKSHYEGSTILRILGVPKNYSLFSRLFLSNLRLSY